MRPYHHYYARFFNDFHNTQVQIEWRRGQPITPRQWRRMREKLCGSKDCACGVIRGKQLWQLEHHGYGPDGTEQVRVACEFAE